LWTNLGFALAGVTLGAAAALAEALDDSGQSYGSGRFVAGGLIAAGLAFAVDIGAGGAYTRRPAWVEVQLEPETARSSSGRPAADPDSLSGD
jgi:hypothetical protein